MHIHHAAIITHQKLPTADFADSCDSLSALSFSGLELEGG
jgi:hypothetical protein